MKIRSLTTLCSAGLAGSLVLIACGGDDSSFSQASQDGGIADATAPSDATTDAGDGAVISPDGSTASFTIGGTTTGLNVAPDAGADLDAGDAAADAGDASDASDASDAGDDGGDAGDAASDAATSYPDTALVLQNGSDTLVVTQNGPFTFPTKVASNGAFAVTILRQPIFPAQTCKPTGASGTVVAGDVTTVVINCTTDQHTFGGTVTGLTGTLVLQDTSGATATVNMNGSYSFGPESSGLAYDVTVKTQPAGQYCTVTGASGTLQDQDVTGVNVSCGGYPVSGTLTGLTGGTLVLENNGGDDVSLTADGTFAFPAGATAAGVYAITVKTPPATRSCSVTTDPGGVATAPVTDIVVTCKDSVLFVNAEANAAYAPDVVANLTATNAFSGVTSFDGFAATPTVAQLAAYSVVLVSTDAGFDDPATMGDNLADYYDAGGRVVLSTFANTDDGDVAGRFGTAANGYMLIDPIEGSRGADSLGVIAEPGSPLLAGVTTFACEACYHSNGALQNGATASALYKTSGDPLVMHGTIKGRNRADLNFDPVSRAVAGFGWTGDGATLIKNALLFH